MTKHAVITIKVPLHEDELERGPQLVAIKTMKDAVASIAAEHGAEVSHEITSPEPVKVPRRPRAAKVSPVVVDVAKLKVPAPSKVA